MSNSKLALSFLINKIKVDKYLNVNGKIDVRVHVQILS